MREHDPSCPRAQFWDAGEHEAPCTCAASPGAGESALDELLRWRTSAQAAAARSELRALRERAAMADEAAAHLRRAETEVTVALFDWKNEAIDWLCRYAALREAKYGR